MIIVIVSGMGKAPIGWSDEPGGLVRQSINTFIIHIITYAQPLLKTIK